VLHPALGVAVPPSARLQTLLSLGRRVHVAAFHFVQRGYIELTTESGAVQVVEAGEIVIGIGGEAHRIAQGNPAQNVPVEVLLKGGSNPFCGVGAEGQRGATLLCGVFLMQDVSLNPLLAALPPWLHLSSRQPAVLHDLPGILERMTQEVGRRTPGSGYAIERLLELLCAEALRARFEMWPEQSQGWFAALKDPVVGRAIALIHAQPETGWSVPLLARHVAMSPSRFAARFVSVLGDSPMAYVTKWRMSLAGRLLAHTRQGVDEISERVGYANAAAFARAFKRHLGASPVAWRLQKQATRAAWPARSDPEIRFRSMPWCYP